MKAKLLEALKQIRERPASKFGICYQLYAQSCSDENTDYWRSKVRSLFRRWPQFSGSEDYPVPHPTKNPEDAYVLHCKRAGLWNRRTKYGQARWDLLEFCISELEKELSNE